jgi:hypothetical protein
MTILMTKIPGNPNWEQPYLPQNLTVPKEASSDWVLLPREVQHYSIAGRIDTSSVIIALAAVIPFVATHTSFHQIAQSITSTFSQSMPLWKIIVISGSAAIGLSYLTYIFLNTLNHKNGKFWGQKHISYITTISLTSESIIFHGLLDLSTLDETGTGVLYQYIPKDNLENVKWSRLFNSHDWTLFKGFFGIPLRIAGPIIYNVFRAVAAPFYVLGCLAKEGFTGKQLYKNERFFRWSDIPKQFALSLRNIVRAPFYGIALYAALLSAIVNPIGGRKLGGQIELAWNDGLHFETGIDASGLNKFTKYEGGGGPESLNKMPCYLFACFQPTAEITVKDYEIKEVTYGSKKSPLKVIHTLVKELPQKR